MQLFELCSAHIAYSVEMKGIPGIAVSLKMTHGGEYSKIDATSNVFNFQLRLKNRAFIYQ